MSIAQRIIVHYSQLHGNTKELIILEMGLFLRYLTRRWPTSCTEELTEPETSPGNLVNRQETVPNQGTKEGIFAICPRVPVYVLFWLETGRLKWSILVKSTKGQTRTCANKTSTERVLSNSPYSPYGLNMEWNNNGDRTATVKVFYIFVTNILMENLSVTFQALAPLQMRFCPTPVPKWMGVCAFIDITDLP